MCTRGIAFYKCQVSVMPNKTSYKHLMLCRIGWLMLSESILYPTRNLSTLKGVKVLLLHAWKHNFTSVNSWLLQLKADFSTKIKHIPFDKYIYKAHI